MHKYRTHTCGELRKNHTGQSVRLSGWIHRKRDHGGVLFLDLRDHYGITQLVFSPNEACSGEAGRLGRESVITVTGEVIWRTSANVNLSMPTGEVELIVTDLTVHSEADPLPFPVAEEPFLGESTRLQYRFLDLRRHGLHRRIQLRSEVISVIRRRMGEMGFSEFQTPILTSSSPEGARDYLVPSRLYPGQFYALPQAPQQFKQLLMVSGFDRYFQIAPCFRDEDARADRSPGEFYQLDLEMAFVEQEDVFGRNPPRGSVEPAFGLGLGAVHAHAHGSRDEVGMSRPDGSVHEFEGHFGFALLDAVQVATKLARRILFELCDRFVFNVDLQIEFLFQGDRVAVVIYEGDRDVRCLFTCIDLQFAGPLLCISIVGSDYPAPHGDLDAFGFGVLFMLGHGFFATVQGRHGKNRDRS